MVNLFDKHVDCHARQGMHTCHATIAFTVVIGSWFSCSKAGNLFKHEESLILGTFVLNEPYVFICVLYV